MSHLTFYWDPRKDAANRKKHDVSFDEAKTAFTDEFGRLIADPDHSADEDRFILLGTSIHSRLLVVATVFETVRPFELSLRERLISESEKLTRSIGMRDHYDFSDSVKNPYAKKLKKQVTIRLDEDTVAYFKNLAEEKDLPYQSLINLYLRDCAQSHKDLKIEWQ
jgi:uncharacterized DUF497 family protein